MHWSAARPEPHHCDLVPAKWLLLLLAVFMVLSVTAAQGQDSSIEGAVKATYLYKFPPFVQWPPGALAADSFTLCIIGNDPLGSVLDRAVSGQRIADRPIVARRLAVFSPDAGCQIVFAAGSPAQPVANILAAVRGRPILSVTDEGREGQPKGILNFVIAENRVRFEIDDQAAAESGLIISSKLLGLALHVRSRN
jgi:YfiR/HmsC-like